MSATLALATCAVAGCSSVLGTVAEASFGALVPTSQQLRVDTRGDIPGGFAPLRASGVDRVDIRVEGDELTVSLDGVTTVSRPVLERREVQDSRGTGPFTAKEEILVLGSDPLVLGDLVIEDPVIWPGGYDGSPIITVKPQDPTERGPVEQCRAADRCLVLTARPYRHPDPRGTYEDRNDPGLGENPLASILVGDDLVEYTLDTGDTIRADWSGEMLTRACGLSESFVWPVPDRVGLNFDDPVLVQTRCPIPDGEPRAVTVMERANLPVLAPLGTQFGGQWCRPGPGCLWFISEAGDTPS